MEWNDIHLVLAVCRAGSLSGAATALELNYSTVFRRINAIEAKLGVRLFDRLPTGYVMTQAGHTVLKAAERMDDEALTLGRQLLGQDAALRGNIRVTAPEGISVRLVVPLLAEFGKQHPEISQELIITSGALSLNQREADIAVRVTRSPPDNYVGYKLCAFRFTMYASQDYLAQHPGKDLVDHAFILLEDKIDWFPATLWSKPVRPRVVLCTQSAQAALVATKAGLGVCPMPCFLGDAEPSLVRLMAPPDALALELWVLTHPDLRHTARVKLLVDSLRQGLLRHKKALEGKDPSTSTRTSQGKMSI